MKLSGIKGEYVTIVEKNDELWKMKSNKKLKKVKKNNGTETGRSVLSHPNEKYMKYLLSGENNKTSMLLTGKP